LTGERPGDAKEPSGGFGWNAPQSHQEARTAASEAKPLQSAAERLMRASAFLKPYGEGDPNFDHKRFTDEGWGET
jgi:hypothetical protein